MAREMHTLQQEANVNIISRKSIRVLFDEWHSESWSCSEERAREMQPEDPSGASYARAAATLAEAEFVVERNITGPLTPERLETTDVLTLVHPCDPHWER